MEKNRKMKTQKKGKQKIQKEKKEIFLNQGKKKKQERNEK